jgi:hypothetical protein
MLGPVLNVNDLFEDLRFIEFLSELRIFHNKNYYDDDDYDDNNNNNTEE